MNKQLWTVALVVAFVCSAGWAADGDKKARPEGDRPANKEHGDRPGGARGEHGDGPLAKVFASLNLTEEQQGKIKDIRQAMMERMKGIMEEAKKARESKDKDAMQRIMQQRHEAFQTFISDVRGVLTPDQQATFDKAVETLKEHRGEGDGPRRRPGAGDGDKAAPHPEGDRKKN